MWTQLSTLTISRQQYQSQKSPEITKENRRTSKSVDKCGQQWAQWLKCNKSKRIWKQRQKSTERHLQTSLNEHNKAQHTTVNACKPESENRTTARVAADAGTMTLSRQKPKSSSLKSAPASNDKYWTPQLIRRSPTSDSLRSMKTPNSDSFMSIKSPRKAPVSPQLKPQLSRSESLSSIKTTKEALGWTLNRQLTKSEGELSVTALGDTPWTSSVVFIGMEVRLMADLAHLLSWDIACAAPRPKVVLKCIHVFVCDRVCFVNVVYHLDNGFVVFVVLCLCLK